MPRPDFYHESRLGLPAVAGIDEAGRGPLAGPVVAAAVILDPAELPEGLDDSKKLSAAQREAAYAAIMRQARAVAVALAPHDLIDRLNIRAATLHAMRQACAALAIAPSHALIDGRDVPAGLCCPATALIGGDGLSLSIAAASIVAKVTRDRLMVRLDAECPHWGFARHMGYPTKAHREAIERHGASPFHRLSFGQLRNLTLGEDAAATGKR